MSEHAQESAFQAPADTSRYLECRRCGHTFERALAAGRACPDCKGALVTQPVLPGLDELTLYRQRRRPRPRRIDPHHQRRP